MRISMASAWRPIRLQREKNMRIARRMSASPRRDLLGMQGWWSAASDQAGSGPPFLHRSRPLIDKVRFCWSLNTLLAAPLDRVPARSLGASLGGDSLESCPTGPRHQITYPNCRRANARRGVDRPDQPRPLGCVRVQYIWESCVLASCWSRKGRKGGHPHIDRLCCPEG